MTIRTYASALLAAGLLAASHAHAEPPWCDGDDRLPDHPLDYDGLRDLVFETGADRTIAAMTALVGREFKKAQEVLPPPADAELAAYVTAFETLLTTSDGHADFKVDHKELHGWASIDTITPFVTYSCDESLTELKSREPSLLNIALAADAIYKIGQEILGRNLPFVSKAIDEVNLSHRNWLLEQGLKQWPWELAFNGWLGRNRSYADAAPRTQWVLMRPNAGLEFQWEDQGSAEVDASIGIEPLGHVWYLGDRDSYDRWIGVSALVTLGTNDSGAGVGGLIRYNKYWLGVTDRRGEDGLFVFIGFDLHNYLKTDDGFKADLEAHLAKLKPPETE